MGTEGDRTKGYKSKWAGPHQFHIVSNFSQDSFPLFVSKKEYAEATSLLVTVAKRESSKLSSMVALEEEESTF